MLLAARSSFRNSFHSVSSLLVKGNATRYDSTSAHTHDIASSSARDDANTIPMLQRPLGLPDPPRSTPMTWEEKRDELLDQEKRMARRRYLIKEATKGYFNDFHATRRHGGKTWIAPSAVIREDKALYFPDIRGTSLDKSRGKLHTTDLCTGKISVVSMLSTKISEFHTAGFTALTNERFERHPLYCHVQINLQENILKSFLVNMFVNSIRKTVPVDQHPTYLVSSQNMEYVREAMGFPNSKIGYVYLLDEKVRIRWAACADAMPEEAQALLNCTQVLLKRLEAKRASELT